MGCVAKLSRVLAVGALQTLRLDQNLDATSETILEVDESGLLELAKLVAHARDRLQLDLFGNFTHGWGISALFFETDDEVKDSSLNGA